MEFMREFETLGHMSVISPNEHVTEDRLCYLPHHRVLREATNKLRVVFNGSQYTRDGHSLNGTLMIGPNLLPRLADILLAWRRHRFVFATDVEKMYRQILVYPDDRDLQRILWRSTSGLQFRLNTVTYGLASAPFLAIRTLQQLAVDEGDRFPLGASVLRTKVYVDDILTGASSGAETMLAANNERLLEGIPEEHHTAGGPLTLQALDATQSTLGLEWDPCRDSFSFIIRLGGESATTKCDILSQAAQLFDPLGWMSPVTIRAKCIIQTTWLRRMGWVERLPDDDVAAWRTFDQDLSQLLSLRIPRWVGLDRPGGAVEVHGFSDASERAYAAALYLKTSESSDVRVSLLLAKTKVAPLRQISLPRLELCAASFLVKIAAHAVEVLKIPSSVVHLWSDSTVALGWI
ncbi:uncharacterized protein LOC112589069 [Harpegnathos saltator]|uniref:uncharacterized protein LOC112589069 n=1 Tax=Harpegnathos saltator TaxID=610380 RepID=UPI000DBEE0C3|nr:uncharacterized protein LOC112589069 [Harpegnathos saltator]